MHNHPHALRWSDVAPSAHPLPPLDPALTARLESAVASSRARGPDAVEDALDGVLVAHAGPWASGWRWSTGEGSLGGGVVHAWCCPAHSVTPGDAGVALRAVAALKEWRAWLERLETLFAALVPAEEELQARLVQATGVLLGEVAHATACEDAWYAHARQVLGWYLESHGAPAAKVEAAVEEATEGIFESWCDVPEDVAEQSAERLARRVTGADGERPLLTPPKSADHLKAHLAARKQVPWMQAPAIAAHAGTDGHQAFMERFDAARSTERAERMRAALRHARAEAAAGRALDLALLSELHEVAVPDALFRHAPAYAKAGRERYGFDGQLRARLEDALADANDTSVPLVARAARAYLDVCFFHPFTDGNGRAARLAFDFLLTREGVVLHDVAPLFRHPLAAGDVATAAGFLTLVTRVAEASARAAGV